MVAIYAPVLPHLAEEVHAVRYPGIEESFFITRWQPLVYFLSLFRYRV